MAISFYCGSGSPFAWKVWLTLEHKGLPYELKLLSFQSGDLKKPEYRAINPRGKVPAIVDGTFALYESTAIVEYLDEKYPAKSVIGSNPEARAVARRISCEVDSCLYPTGRKLLAQTLFLGNVPGDPAEIAKAKADVHTELERFASYTSGGFLVGDQPTVADYALYTTLALMRRVGARQPENGVIMPDRLQHFMAKVEALPYFDVTVPPHWKNA